MLWVVAYPAVDGETLLSYGGPLSLAIASQSLPVSLGVFWLLRRRCTTGSRAAIACAWILGSLYLVWSVLAGFSLAAWALPAALLLMLAVGFTPRPAVPSPACP